MIRAYIEIVLKSGRMFAYANKYLAAKSGDDGYTGNGSSATPLFKGYDGVCYYYTGSGTDTYDLQTGLGKIKGDFDHLVAEITAGTNKYILFPEGTLAAHEDTDTLIRKNSTTINGGEDYIRTKVLLSEIDSIKIVEEFVPFPYGRESGYQLPKDSNDFRGFNEYANLTNAEKGSDAFQIVQRTYDQRTPAGVNVSVSYGTSDDSVSISVLNTYNFDSIMYSINKAKFETYNMTTNSITGTTSTIDNIQFYGIKDGFKGAITYKSI